MSRPSYLAWKGEEHRTQKTQTYASSLPVLSHAPGECYMTRQSSPITTVLTQFFLGKMNGLTSLLSLTSATSPAVKKLLGWKQVTRFFINSHLSRLSAARGYSHMQFLWVQHEVFPGRKFRQSGVLTLGLLSSKYERILLLASRILVGRIRILKYDVFWLGVFGIFWKSCILAYLHQITTMRSIFKF